jgi:hypothetical protein
MWRLYAWRSGEPVLEQEAASLPALSVKMDALDAEGVVWYVVTPHGVKMRNAKHDVLAQFWQSEIAQRFPQEAQMEEIVIEIDRDGTFIIEGKGFKDSACKEFTKALEAELGDVTDVQLKPEGRVARAVTRTPGRVR